MSAVYPIFNPFGFIAPYVMKATLLLLTLSRKSLSRDDPLEEDDKKQWKCWLDNLPKQQEMQVVHCFKLKGFSEVKEVQLVTPLLRHFSSMISSRHLPPFERCHQPSSLCICHGKSKMRSHKWNFNSKIGTDSQCYLRKALQNYSRRIGHDSRSSLLLDWLSFRVEVHQLC